MEEDKRKAYSEVVEILKLVEDEEKIEKIPFEVIQLIKSNSDPTYTPNISKEIPLEEQNLRDETYRILAWIANKYWDENIIVEDTEESETEIKSEIDEISEEKDLELGKINNKEEIKNASVYNDIEPECLEQKNLPILAEMSWFEKIKKKVIQLFKILFRMNLNNKEEGAKE